MTDRTTKPEPAPLAILVRPRVYIGNEISLGPGKIDLLRWVGQTKSISAAGRELGIPYKRAWLLINTLNAGFGQPVVLTTKGGRGGGGAQLTPLGQALIERYQALEDRIVATSAAELEALKALAG
ncbi:LysR family transcriptional regulator [Ideonella dechloratans]|uniref:LysR family transcriptional regulator n=1 Tax=Ideonella dechloratans TaxID=36863 RepID=A0A643FHV7_IDEDE|nr:LysR family transcriptional regulator [Ideonella dechloratans]KAB0583843.1 LysR family transcriptional regulator [Ideonella dechloratans]UFU12053.1 LysR family transcriptional regulator [Ideonella dechloratans]